MNSIYFQFSSFIYVAQYKQQTIILNVLKNQYLSLNDKAGKYLCFIVLNQIKFKNRLYSLHYLNSNDSIEIDNECLNYYIKFFIKEKIIESTFVKDRRNKIEFASMPIGLNRLDWTRTNSHNTTNNNFFEVIKVLIALIKIHRIIKKKSLNGLITLLNSQRNKIQENMTVNSSNINQLSNILDSACMIYPKKTLCLPWAGTFAYILLKKGIPCNFFIGVQTEPFYAHAWVEYKGKVINDNPEVQNRLAPILNLSFIK